MDNEVKKMLAELKSAGIPASKAELDLNFSNGLLGKAAKGKCSLSADKLAKLINYCYVGSPISSTAQLKVSSELPPLPIIDNDCRAVKDYCKENGLAVTELIEFHQSAKEKIITDKKTKKEEHLKEKIVKKPEASGIKMSLSDQIDLLIKKQING